jgi:DnaJ-class molecular chaperone
MTEAYIDTCPKCKGEGGKDIGGNCSNCKGKGKIKMKDGGTLICIRCKGSGKIPIFVACNECNGVGYVMEFF